MNRRPILPISSPAMGHPVGMPPLAGSRRGTDRSEHFEHAQQLMEEGRWQSAFAQLAELADAGHAQAARLALLFVHRGTRLFGGSYSASPRQRECWQRASD